MTTTFSQLISPVNVSRFMACMTLFCLVGFTSTVQAGGSLNVHESVLYTDFDVSDGNAFMAKESLMEGYLVSKPDRSTLALPFDFKCPPDVFLRCVDQFPDIPLEVSDLLAQGGFAESTCGIDEDAISVSEVTIGVCPQEIERTITVTDRCGEQMSCTQLIVIENSMIPPAIECPANITVLCPSNIPSVNEQSVNTSGSCGIATVTHMRDDSINFGSCPAFLIRYYMAEDQCGNVSTCAQTITISDNCDSTVPCDDICDADVPVFNVDFSGSPDANWTSPEVFRAGVCCESLGNPAESCVHFTLTLDAETVALTIEDLSGTLPAGTTFALDCGAEYSLGELHCLPGGTTYEVTICEPGAGPNVFSITAYSIDVLEDGNNNGVPDNCEIPCDQIFVGFDECAAIYIGYAPAECTDLTVSTLGGAPPFTYEWSTGETSETINVCPRDGNPTFSVTVTDTKGCTGEATITVKVIKVTCGGGTGILVCHFNPLSGLYVTECVDESEVPLYLENGDVLGACGDAPCRENDNPVLYGNGHVILGDPEKGGGRPRAKLPTPTGTTDMIFPNPVTDELTIQFEMTTQVGVELAVFNAQGVLVHSTKRAAVPGVNTVGYDASNLADGIYLVSIFDGQSTKLLKFVKSAN